jgi:hypothetical protein
LYLVKAWVSGFHVIGEYLGGGILLGGVLIYYLLTAHPSFSLPTPEASTRGLCRTLALVILGTPAARVPLRRRVVLVEGILSEVWGMPEKARRVLQAAAVEANGRPGMYVVMDQVMYRANISDPEEYRAIAGYLEERGCIAEADLDYGVFVLTPEGIDEALK